MVLPGVTPTTIDYIGDARGRRVGKAVNNNFVQGFLYQGKLDPVAEIDAAGFVTARFIYAEASAVPAYMMKGGVAYRIIGGLPLPLPR